VELEGKTVGRWPTIGRASWLGPLGWLIRQHPEIDVKKIYYRSIYTSVNITLPTQFAALPVCFLLSRASICEQNLHCTGHAFSYCRIEPATITAFSLTVDICPDAPLPSCSRRDLSHQAKPAPFQPSRETFSDSSNGIAAAFRLFTSTPDSLLDSRFAVGLCSPQRWSHSHTPPFPSFAGPANYTTTASAKPSRQHSIHDFHSTPLKHQQRRPVLSRTFYAS